MRVYTHVIVKFIIACSTDMEIVILIRLTKKNSDFLNNVIQKPDIFDSIVILVVQFFSLKLYRINLNIHLYKTKGTMKLFKKV